MCSPCNVLAERTDKWFTPTGLHKIPYKNLPKSNTWKQSMWILCCGCSFFPLSRNWSFRVSFYDEKLMPGHLQQCLSAMKVEQFPHVPGLDHREVIKRRKKLHCICHKVSRCKEGEDGMTECSGCCIRFPNRRWCHRDPWGRCNTIGSVHAADRKSVV